MSSDAVYTPGSWVAVGAESGWLLVDLDPTDAIVLKCWSLLRGGAEIDEILDAVLQRGLRAVNSFALARVSGEQRAVVVRGAAEAVITVGGTDQKVSAAGVATWREYPLPAEASAVALHAGVAAGGAETPLSPGVTLASSLRLAVSGTPLAPRPAPEPPAQALNGSGAAAPPAPPQAEQPPPPSETEPDAMAWVSAVKPLGPLADDESPPRPGVVSSGPGSGTEGPQPQQSAPPAASAWSPPPEADSPDSTSNRPGLTEPFGPGSNMVQAVRCQHGHLSPPIAVSCRVCGFPLMGQAPVIVPRPTLGVLRLSTGDVVPLDRTVIMGRNPRVDESSEGERPHVVRLPSPGHDISRTHVEIRLDGWHVLLTDLNSVNGTVVTPPWQEPQRVRPNEAVPIEPGTVVSMADEVTFRYEVTA
jgi:FHA domain-containing protein